MEIRWQIMRGFESSVQVDCENIALRRLIENLQHKSLTSTAKHDDTLRAFKNKFDKLVKVARGSLVDNRLYSETQFSSINSQMTAVRDHVKDLGAMNLNTDGDLAATITAKRDLEKLVDKLKGEIVEISTQRKTENERNSAKISQLRIELGEADARHTQDKLALTELRMETDSLANTNNSLLDQIKTLRMWAQKMEMDGLQTVAEAQEQRQRMQEGHDNITSALLAEAAENRESMNEMQVEIQRLQAILAQPVQETHFQKFVNLKKANVQLKSKLGALSREHQHNEANGIVGAKPSKDGNSSGNGMAFQRPGGKPPRKETHMSLQQQVYLASVERERLDAQELAEKQEYLQLYGQQQEVPPMPALVGVIPSHPPVRMPGGSQSFAQGDGRARSTSPINDNLPPSENVSPRSNVSSSQFRVRPVNSRGGGGEGGGLQIGVPLMGKQTRESLSQRESVDKPQPKATSVNV